MKRVFGRRATVSLAGCFLFALTGSGALAAAAPAALEPLQGALSQRTRAARSRAPRLAVHVVDLATGQEIFAHNPDRPLIVASNTKLVTTAAALEELGPGFMFETPLFLKGALEGDVFVGDLAVQGSGDPNISGRHFYGDSFAIFRSWARRLRDMGIRQIEGQVLLDHGAFEDVWVHPDWPRDQLMKWYEAPVDALSFSDNCVLVRIYPGRRSGDPARIELVPELPLFTVRSSAVTTSSARRHWIAVDRASGTNEIKVAGRIYRGADPVETWVTVHQPAEYFGAALVEAFDREGVPVSGGFRTVTELPVGPWWRFAVHRSDLLTTLQVINRRSQNFYAESLIKTLARRLCAEGTWEAGKSILRDFLDRVGIRRDSYVLADGSGMSRQNQLSARQLTRLLTYMYSHPLRREFASTLPFSGLEDHHRWRTRLAEEPYRNNVLAKTGSLRAVSTLSGYAKALSGRTYAFSILCNEVASITDARHAQDGIVRALVDHG